LKGWASSLNLTVSPETWDFNIIIAYPFRYNNSRLAIKCVIDSQTFPNYYPTSPTGEFQVPNVDTQYFLIPPSPAMKFKNSIDLTDNGYVMWDNTATVLYADGHYSTDQVIVSELLTEGEDKNYGKSMAEEKKQMNLLNNPSYGYVSNDTHYFVYFSFIVDSPPTLVWEAFVGLDEVQIVDSSSFFIQPFLFKMITILLISKFYVSSLFIS